MKKLLSFVFIVAAALSCTNDSNLPGDSFGEGPKIVGFGTSLEAISYFSDEGVVEKSFPVNLIGLGNGQTSSEPIVVNYTVDTEASTAVEGVEYDFGDATGSITIPAGGTFGMLNLNVHTGSFNPDVPTQLVLKLTSASGETVVGAEESTLTVKFVGCLADLEGTYTITLKRESTGAVSTQTNQHIVQTGTNQFRTENTGSFTPGQAPDPNRQGFNFTVLCGEIVVPSQGLFDNQYSNEVVGVPMTTGDYVGFEGHVIDANSFIIRYKANAGGATGFITWTATYVRNN
ncbi:MAG: hypothetical protein EOO51_10110 [Flavobacterium sp.]|nr:MAG: hypothetical protein EOO51_10110 [Flavobacterium sp.]